jgi:hypothetical protein
MEPSTNQQQNKQPSDGKMEKLQMFAQNPELAMFDLLDEMNEKLSTCVEALRDLDLSEVETIKGDKPEKGVDYFTEDEVDQIKELIAEEVTPIKGVHYFDGEKPERGMDYDTEEDKTELWKEITKYIDKKLKK